MLRIHEAIRCDRSCAGSVLSKTRREDKTWHGVNRSAHRTRVLRWL